ncbi:MAG: protein translocase subunit SecD [Acidimicrobiales bacterium]
MARRQVTYALGISFVALAALIYTFVAGNEPLLGLDLQGGVSVRYRATEPVEDPTQIDQAVEIIRNRVDGLGVAEPEIQAQGDGILVSLPGVEDKERALELVGETAVMRFRPVLEELPVGGLDRPISLPADAPLGPDGFTPVEEIEETDIIIVAANAELARPARYVLGPSGMTGEGLSDAAGVFNGVQWLVNVDLKGGAIGDDAFRALTELCAPGVSELCPGAFDGSGEFHGRIAVDLDNEVISAPFVQASDLGDSFQISGAFDETTARELGLKLRFGALPIQLEPENQQIVSATIGSDALDAGVIAGVVGLVLVAIFIIGYYRILGLVAMLSLVISAALLWSIISFLGANQGLALTLAGITGIIVSIGVSVDSNIVYFEHLKEDVRNGRTVRTAVNKAFPVAFSTIVKADMASLIGAILLYLLTVGAVRGFALYLGIATVLDLIATYFFMGPAVQWLARKPAIAGSSALMGIAGLDADRVGTDDGEE